MMCTMLPATAVQCSITVCVAGPAEPIGQVGFWPDQKISCNSNNNKGVGGLYYNYGAITCNTKQLVGKPCSLINELSFTGVASYFLGDSRHASLYLLAPPIVTILFY